MICCVCHNECGVTLHFTTLDASDRAKPTWRTLYLCGDECRRQMISTPTQELIDALFSKESC